jgi:methylated-DNA-[protein]-cysteine S-methyltransferase
MTRLEDALKGAGLPKGDAGIEAATGLLLARAEDEGLVDIAFTTVESPIGNLLVAATKRGLVRVSWDPDEEQALERLAADISPRIFEAPARLDDTRRQLDEYFGGRRKHFDLKLDWSLTRGFTQKLLRQVAKLDYGELSTYKRMAEAAGSPRAVRAAGNALGANPIPVIVPCHRVVQSSGLLGGYGGKMNSPIKRRLLELEGALEPGQERLF